MRRDLYLPNQGDVRFVASLHFYFFSDTLRHIQQAALFLCMFILTHAQSFFL